MSDLLDKAIAEIKSLPEDAQEAIASDILQMIESEKRWDKLFADPRSERFFEKMAAEVRAETENGTIIDGDPSDTKGP